MEKVIICVYEDRATMIVGLKVLVLSAQRHEPLWHMILFLRNIDESDYAWFRAQPNVELRINIDINQHGWNVKASLLTLLIKEFNRTVIWCDSDIILSGPVSPVINSFPDGCIIATEEYHWGRTRGSETRCKGWGFEDVRKLPVTVNTCLIKIEPTHLAFLESWEKYLNDSSYRHAQENDWFARPFYYMGDQDVFTALIASREFGDIQLHLLRSGIDIAQCFEEDGYTVRNRLRNAILRRIPPLVHAQGRKPWLEKARTNYQQLSPFAIVAKPYLIDEGLPLWWTRPENFTYRLMDFIFRQDPNLRGMPIAFSRGIKRVVNKVSEILLKLKNMLLQSKG